MFYDVDDLYALQILKDIALLSPLVGMQEEGRFILDVVKMLEPEDALAPTGLSFLALTDNDPETAIDILQTAARQAKTNVDKCEFLLIATLMRMQRYDEAKEWSEYIISKYSKETELVKFAALTIEEVEKITLGIQEWAPAGVVEAAEAIDAVNGATAVEGDRQGP